MTSLTRTCRGTGGFTLIEVLAAIGMIGVIGAIAATNFNAYLPGYRARGAALQIAGDMSQARLSAVKESRRYYFAPQAGSTYQIQADNGLGGRTVLKTVNIVLAFPDTRFAATGITNDPYGNAITTAVPATAIVFNSNGTITNAASVYVEPTMDYTQAQQGVVVTAAGRIRVWRYNGTAWN